MDNTNNNNNSSNNSNDQKDKEQCVKVLNEFSWGCGKGNGLEGFSQQPIPLSQGSIGSQGSASSGISESESQPSQPQGSSIAIPWILFFNLTVFAYVIEHLMLTA